MGKKTRDLDVTVGGIRFVATFPLVKDTENGIELHHMIAWDRWVVETLCERGQPSSDGFKFLRQRSGLKAAELAALLDVRAETISRWETGDSEVSVATWDIVGALASDRVNDRTTTVDRLCQRKKAQAASPKRVEMRATGT